MGTNKITLAKYVGAFLAVLAPSSWPLGLAVGLYGGLGDPGGYTAASFDVFNTYFSASTVLGVKIGVPLWHSLAAESAVTYHLGHERAKWYDNPYVEVPVAPLTAFTVGANYGYNFHNVTFRAGGGGGYYFKRLTAGDAWHFVEGPIWYTTDVDLSAPGLYAGAGISYNLGRFALDFMPRYHVIFNEGVYSVTGTGYSSTGRRYDINYPSAEKDFNDTYFEALFGVNFSLI